MTFYATFGTITTMSTPRRIDPKAANKRRAARRRQARETMARVGIIAIVAILILSTISTVIVPTAISPIISTPTSVPPTATQANVSGLQAIANQGDQLAAGGDYVGATSLYRAYLAQDPTNGEVHFKLGKAYLNLQPPNYLDALASLQQAVNINPSAPYAQEALSLIDQNKDKVGTPGAITGTVTTPAGTSTITGTTTTTGTVPPTTPPAGATQTP